MGTWTTSDAGGQGGCTYTTWTDIDVSCDGVESTLGDEAHAPGQVSPMRAQQAHVKVTSPAKAHSVNTSAIAKHGGRLRMESARLSIPYRGTHEREVLEKETPHPTPDISTSVTSPMIWSLYSLRKGAINPRHAWHAAPTADGPPPSVARWPDQNEETPHAWADLFLPQEPR